MPAVAAITSKAVSEMLGPYGTPPRATIAPELPPDHPLEPGTRPSGRAASPSERIAASESAISEIAASTREQASTSNFIAAARRAAQAAAAAQVNDKTARSPAKKPASDKAKEASAAGKATLVPVKVGVDSDLRVEIISGLTAEDEDVRHPPSGLCDGADVEMATAK